MHETPVEMSRVDIIRAQIVFFFFTNCFTSWGDRYNEKKNSEIVE